MADADLLERARNGDGEAFRELAEPYRRELLADRGRATAAKGIGQLFAQGHRYRLIETRANGQPAFALYRQDPHAGILHASGLLVATLAGSRVSAMTMFTPYVLARFGLPRTLPA
jgi:hypothetical protein